MEAAIHSPSAASPRATKAGAGAPNGSAIETRSTSKNDDHAATSDRNTDDSCINSPSTTSPPYWVQSHQRSFSNVSVDSIVKGGITLQDNTDGDDSRNRACWAKSVHIENHVVVGSGIGAFVTWNINVETLQVPFYRDSIQQHDANYGQQGGSLQIRKRYSEFDDLRHKLIQTFPYSEAAMPPIPPKSVISKFRPKFLENRRTGLQYFLKSVAPYLCHWTDTDN